jgi:hypothetical protein
MTTRLKAVPKLNWLDLSVERRIRLRAARLKSTHSFLCLKVDVQRGREVRERRIGKTEAMAELSRSGGYIPFAQEPVFGGCIK